MKTNLTFTDFMVEASKNYLTEELPTNYSEWSDTVLDAYIETFKAMFIEDYSVEQIYVMIENSAEGFWRMYKESLPVMCN